MEATTAIVAPIIQTCGLRNPEKSGKVIKFLKSSTDCGTGSVTKCSLEISRALPLKTSLNKIPTITATKAPGKSLIFLRKFTFSQVIRIAREIIVTKTAPGVMAFANPDKYSDKLKPSKI